MERRRVGSALAPAGLPATGTTLSFPSRPDHAAASRIQSCTVVTSSPHQLVTRAVVLAASRSGSSIHFMSSMWMGVCGVGSDGATIARPFMTASMCIAGNEAGRPVRVLSRVMTIGRSKARAQKRATLSRPSLHAGLVGAYAVAPRPIGSASL